MSSQMVIRIDEKQRQKLNQISRAEGKATSQVLRELIDGFIKDHDLGGYIDDLWSRIGKSISQKGFTPDDIPGIIAESRKASR